MSERLTCAVNDCDGPAAVRVFPTNGETDHSALRCWDCLDEDRSKDWFDQWARSIRTMRAGR